MPQLRFELVQAVADVDSVTLGYRGAAGMAAEVFFLDADAKVTRAFAHHANDV